ncbi:unnamed protein product [Microthlaspi erraticum]|uniref:Arabidopsis retrotransposon Orf1 C-terminal domain-containing protein n=1 Tax=Microthlaspi erraticum TaxID=1685480 RepID=A0A6D2HTJ8_9BRAS|nr:unnamed protein product [Microthlaspi erraticum]
MARGSGEIDHTGNLMPFLDHLLTYKITAYNTRHQRGKALSVGGLITPILCAAGVNPTDKRATEPGWMDIKFCKTNLSLSTRSWMGVPIQVHTSIGWPSKLLLPNPELTTVVREEPELDRAEDRAEDQVQESADLGEPECYYFEEYEAPRMNPSVVAAHKRIGLLQKFNKWQGKAMKDAKVHGQDGEQDQKFGEEGFWFFKQEEEVQAPTFLGVDHSSPLQGGSLPKSLTEPLLSSQGKGEDNSQRRRKSSKARRSSSTTGLDRVQTEETQLDRADGRVEEEPQFEIRIRVRSNALPGDPQ